MAKIKIEGKDEILQNILNDIVKHFNNKQDNFKLITEGITIEDEEPDEKIRVIIYTTHTCPWCNKLRDYLKNNDVTHTEKVITDNEKYKNEMQKKSGQLGVPVIDFEGEIIVGFDEGALNKAITKPTKPQ